MEELNAKGKNDQVEREAFCAEMKNMATAFNKLSSLLHNGRVPVTTPPANVIQGQHNIISQSQQCNHKTSLAPSQGLDKI